LLAKKLRQQAGSYTGAVNPSGIFDFEVEAK
jgi:hypothetical protein